MFLDEYTPLGEDDRFTIINEEGAEVQCDVLFTFDCEETGKSYIVYTDNSTDENGQTQVFASTYDPSEEEKVLLPIETEEEWAMIESVMQELTEEFGPQSE